MELRQAHPLRALHDDDRRLGHVQADLDDARPHEQARGAGAEGLESTHALGLAGDRLGGFAEVDVADLEADQPVDQVAGVELVALVIDLERAADRRNVGVRLTVGASQEDRAGLRWQGDESGQEQNCDESFHERLLEPLDARATP